MKKSLIPKILKVKKNKFLPSGEAWLYDRALSPEDVKLVANRMMKEKEAINGK